MLAYLARIFPRFFVQARRNLPKFQSVVTSGLGLNHAASATVITRKSKRQDLIDRPFPPVPYPVHLAIVISAVDDCASSVKR